MAQLTATATRGGRLVIPNSAANVSAGNYTGANSAPGVLVGTANGRTRIDAIRVQATGDTVENELRVYREKISSGEKTLIAVIRIPKNTVSFTERRVPWIWQGVLGVRLFSTDYRLAYQLEAVPGSSLVIEEEAVDYA